MFFEDHRQVVAGSGDMEDEMLASFCVKKKRHIVLNRPSSSARIYTVHVSLGF